MAHYNGLWIRNGDKCAIAIRKQPSHLALEKEKATLGLKSPRKCHMPIDWGVGTSVTSTLSVAPQTAQPFFGLRKCTETCSYVYWGWDFKVSLWGVLLYQGLILPNCIENLFGHIPPKKTPRFLQPSILIVLADVLPKRIKKHPARTFISWNPWKKRKNVTCFLLFQHTARRPFGRIWNFGATSHHNFDIAGSSEPDSNKPCLQYVIKKLRRIQGCRFGPESKPNPGNQYLDPAWYHLWRIVSENVFRGPNLQPWNSTSQIAMSF